MQFNLFEKTEWEPIPAVDAEIRLWRSFLPPDSALTLLEQIRHSVAWRQDKIRLYGKEHFLPRLQQWFGDSGHVYRWSGIEMIPEPWSPTLLEVKAKVESASGAEFNSLLVNYYRNGSDTVSWHSDDEPSLGSNPTIASVSLGITRDFLLRHKTRSEVPKLSLQLTNGSLLVMAGSTQKFWEHTIPRRAGIDRPRINLTFRNIENHRRGT
jgi:alkylated DNA repair dioxygenase AlkB